MTYQKEIDSTHPLVMKTSDSFKVDALAMKLVSERHGKADLIDLVRWLILRNISDLID